ncbi:MAG: peptidoglycan bridge formation glycyltransferase FemA/FemB family protein [Salinibacterium sp.]|nr:peptidoglycan bridge formation glycyltransferase FemA/FemB family protein [Salinibacterium sp.]
MSQLLESPARDVTHFLQSEAWARFQRARGRTVVEDAGEGWRWMAILEHGRFGSRLYVPYGPVVTRENAYADAAASLIHHGRNVGAMYVRVEPIGVVTREEVLAFGGRRTQQVQPSLTNRVDLRSDWDAIVGRMSQQTRRAATQFDRRGIRVRASDDPGEIEVLLGFLDEVSHRTSMRLHPRSYLSAQAHTFLPRGDGKLYIAELDRTPIAAALFYDDPVRRYYAHAGAAGTFRSLNAGTAILATAMRDAKDKGLSELDLYGVSPQALTDHPWAGFSRFKRTFGGSDVVYLGAWEHTVRPSADRLRRIGASARALVRHVPSAR